MRISVSSGREREDSNACWACFIPCLAKRIGWFATSGDWFSFFLSFLLAFLDAASGIHWAAVAVEQPVRIPCSPTRSPHETHLDQASRHPSYDMASEGVLNPLHRTQRESSNPRILAVCPSKLFPTLEGHLHLSDSTPHIAQDLSRGTNFS